MWARRGSTCASSATAQNTSRRSCCTELCPRRPPSCLPQAPRWAAPGRTWQCVAPRSAGSARARGPPEALLGAAPPLEPLRWHRAPPPPRGRWTRFVHPTSAVPAHATTATTRPMRAETVRNRAASAAPTSTASATTTGQVSFVREVELPAAAPAPTRLAAALVRSAHLPTASFSLILPGTMVKTSKCFNCDEFGHESRDCTKPCGICQSTQHKSGYHLNDHLYEQGNALVGGSTPGGDKRKPQGPRGNKV
mmetsp:Transcript_35830/g.114145  ORF Transcript_35830/g.114145 Transcript_35830/m.114145 type:complete len:251 (+) Transcript_35830:5093-5845(+)